MLMRLVRGKRALRNAIQRRSPVHAQALGLEPTPSRLPLMTMAPLPKMNQGQERRAWHKGLVVISRAPSLRSLAILTLGAGMAEGVIGVIGVPWLVTVLHGGAVERGWLATAQGIGDLLGGCWAARSHEFQRMGWTFLAFGCLSLALTWGVTLPMPSSLRWSVALLIKGASGIPLVIGTVRLRAALIRWEVFRAVEEYGAEKLITVVTY